MTINFIMHLTHYLFSDFTEACSEFSKSSPVTSSSSRSRGKKLKLDRNTELARAVDVMMTKAFTIDIYILHFYILHLHSEDQCKHVDLLFCVATFSKRNKKHVLRVSIELA